MLKAELAKEPFAVDKADVIAVGNATISAMTDIYLQDISESVVEINMESSYHMKTLISKFSCLIAGSGIYAGTFLI